APGAVAAFERAIQLGPNAEQVPEVQVGLSLAQVEAGQLDAALERLRAATGPKAAALAQANLPQAHLRRALARLHAGDGPGAAKDIDAAERADSRKSPELGRFAQWVQGLVRVEEGRFAEAKAATKKALSPTPRWAEPNAPALTEAFVAYRANGLSAARKALSAGSRRAGPKQSEWLAQLAQAIDEREGERAYAQGAMAKAETAFRSAAAAAPEDPKIRHNLACVAYRKGRVTEALEVWKQLQSTLPQASMNLGIDAQERQKNYDAAVGFYQQYVAANGPKAAVVKEWKERLQSFYGIAEAAPAASGGGR
ncbi:MAG TPA: tetratricopeptide repeat protein, partial [Myxococcaceae bacterium]|nr:tetratricopeptide repeat protein [Myxococcaceae bacterium]